MGDGTSIIDPSRIAAQVVSGIGFLGAGVIFVRQNTVAGLTTAASIWVTASIGMACGAGMPLLGIAGTVLHLFAVWMLGVLGRRVRPAASDTLVIRYREGTGALRQALQSTSRHKLEVRIDEIRELRSREGRRPRFRVSLMIHDPRAEPSAGLLAELADIPGVLSVATSSGRRS